MRSSVEASFSHSGPIGVTVRAQSGTGTENIQAINASVPVQCRAGSRGGPLKSHYKRKVASRRVESRSPGSGQIWMT